MDILQAIQQCALNVEPVAIIALMKQESNLKPYQIGINHSRRKLKRQPSNHTEAVAWATHLIQQGYNIDMGLMQINSSNLKKLGLNVDEIFEPCVNLRAGAQILLENYQRASLRYGHGKGAFYSALSAYNTGHFSKGFSNGYVHKVIHHLKQSAKPISMTQQNRISQPSYAFNARPMQPKKPTPHVKSFTDLTIEERLRKTYTNPSEAAHPLNNPSNNQTLNEE